MKWFKNKKVEELSERLGDLIKKCDEFSETIHPILQPMIDKRNKDIEQFIHDVCSNCKNECGNIMSTWFNTVYVVDRKYCKHYAEEFGISQSEIKLKDIIEFNKKEE